jgi:hypothetical protein
VRVDGRDQFRLWGGFRSGPLKVSSAKRSASARSRRASFCRLRHVRRIGVGVDGRGAGGRPASRAWTASRRVSARGWAPGLAAGRARVGRRRRASRGGSEFVSERFGERA